MRASTKIGIVVVAAVLWPQVGRADIFATGRPTGGGATVFRYSSSGQFLGRYPANNPLGSEEFDSLTRGPDGNLYMLGNVLGGGSIHRVDVAGDGSTQTLYQPTGGGPETWQLTIPFGIAFDPTGRLHVGSNRFRSLGAGTTAVYRYDGPGLTSRLTFPAEAQLGDVEFDPAGNLFVGVAGEGIRRYSFSGLAFTIPTSTRDFNFGPDGHLYVATPSSGVLEFNPATGAALGTFVPAGSQGLADVGDLVFGDDGVLYVNSPGALKIFKFDASTGAPLGVFAEYGGASGVAEIGSIAYVVPEPAAGVMLAIGLTCALTVRRRHRHR